MDTSKSDKYKYKANYYRNKNAKHPQRDLLEPGSKGFLCSCNNKEKECIREAYNLLNLYADALEKPDDDEDLSKSAENCKDADIAEELANEISVLKSEHSVQKKRFQVVNIGAKNFLFIRTTISHPVKLAEKIMSDIAETKQQQSRFLIRLVPIETTCKAYIKDIEKAFEPLLDRYFKLEDHSFSVAFNHRNNNSLSRDEVIKLIADKVASSRAGHKVNLKEPDLTIVIEVVKSIALLAVVPNYFKYKKYNLHALCDNASSENVKTETCE